MRIDTFLLCWALLWPSVAPAAAPSPAARWKAPGDPQVQTLQFDWTDAARGRTLPVKLYLPKDPAEPVPVIVFSPGLGGTRDGYEYLGRHWASHGYAVLHLQHPGSDDAVWRGSTRPLATMRAAAANPRNAAARPLDVRFAIDQLLRLNGEAGPLRGRLATNRIGVAGHSFGAYTTLAVAGQAFGAGQPAFADRRVKAAVAMSAPFPRGATEASFRRISIPVLHLTGTEDNSPIGETSAAQRRLPFDRINGPPQYLITLAGADHMVFSGRSGPRGDRTKDPVFHDLIRLSSTAFWAAWLKDDPAARDWLTSGALERELGANGLLESKGISKSQPEAPH